MSRFLLGLFCLCFPAVAAAAACCLSTSTFGTGRLAIWEEAAFGLSSSYGAGHGAYDPAGRYLPYTDYVDREGRILAWGIFRLSPTLEASIRVPWVVGERAAADLWEVGTGPGDLAAGLRWDVIPIGAWQGLPGVALSFGVSAPSGRAPGQSHSPLGSDITTRGAWTASFGMSLEKAHDPWFVRLDVAGIASFPSTVGGSSQRFGPGLEMIFGGGVEPWDGLVFSLAPRLHFEGEGQREGLTVSDSAQRETGLGLAGAWKFDPHWTLQAGVDRTLPLDGFTKNRAVRTTGNVGLRYGWF